MDHFTRFPIRLKQSRLLRNISQSELSKATGISQPVLSRYESVRENVIPNTFNILELADFLKVTPEYLLGVEKDLIIKVDTKVDAEKTQDYLLMKKIVNFSSNHFNSVFQNLRMLVNKPGDFFMQNEDDALSPYLRIGDILMFTIEGDPVNEDVLLIQREHSQRKELRLFEKKGNHIYLIATYGDHMNYRVKTAFFDEHFVLLGRLVGFFRLFFEFGKRSSVI